ncbi:MAG TPA: copper chaperone PCu(A)C [Alphaproteobacteria bacterium]
MELSRRRVVQSALLAGASVAGTPVLARVFYWGTLAVSDAWAPPTGPGVTVAKVYMIIENRGSDSERLLSVRSPVARTARFIEDDPQNGVVEQVAYLEVRPRRPVTLRPGRIHVELQGLAKPLVKGSTFPLTLVFAFAGPVEVPVDIDER